MENISREAILRMVGLHDKAHLMRQINAIQLSLEEEQGMMVAYWTEIRKTEREVTLIAGRMDDAETDIAQLQVTAGQISADVSSLTTTVNGHTTQIGELTVTTSSISASVSSLTTTVNTIDGTVTTHTSQISTLTTDLNGISATVTADHTTLTGHTTQIGALEVTTSGITQRVSSISDEVDAIDGTVTTHTSQISTLTTDLNGISATVTADHTTLGTHTTQIGALQVESTSISGRVTAIEGDYVKEAEISLMVKKDSSGYISNASIKADRIDFTFTQSTNFVSNGTTVMNINSNGDLWILGEYKGGSITGQITVGTGTNKMYIQPNSSNGADLVGYSGSTEVLKLGFVAGEGTWTSITPSLEMKYYAMSSLNFTATLKPYYLSIKNNTSGLEANIQADRISIDGDIRATSFAIKSGSTVYTGVTRTVTIGSTTLTIKGGIITDVS